MLWLPWTTETYFYPRSPCGERQPAEHHANSQQEFLSTLSLRRATGRQPALSQSSAFLSTLSLRRATLRVTSSTRSQPNFYPRSPCGERRAFIMTIIICTALFLSTLSLRRATLRVSVVAARGDRFLSTLSLRRATTLE